jgi:outer membrane receptor protein involved in Fe transport
MWGGAGGRAALGGYRGDGHRENGASEEWTASAGWSTGRWWLKASGEGRLREDPGPLAPAAIAADPGGSSDLFDEDRDRTRRLRSAVTYHGPARWRATAHGTTRRSDTVRTLLLAPGLGDRKQRDLATDSLGLTLEGERSWERGDAVLRYGFDASRDRLDVEYRDRAHGPLLAAEGDRRERAALYATHGFRPHRRLRWTAGLRWDRVRDRSGGPEAGAATAHDAWSPRLGAVAEVGGGVQVHVQAARSFKTATPEQLFDPRPFPDFGGGSFTISSPDLEPQRARSLEVGARRAAPRGRFEVVYYRMRVEDEIDFDPRTFRYANIGSSRHEGVEAGGRLRLSGGVEPFATYAWTRAEPLFGENRGRQLKNIPRHQAQAGVHAPLPGGLRLTARGSFLGGRCLDDAATVRVEDQLSWDLRLDRRIDRLRVYLDLLNLADEPTTVVGYVLADLDGRPTPLRFPGAGRSARVGAVWSF